MFSTRLPRAVVLALLVVAPALVAQESQKYLLPPQNIIDVFDAEPPAQISVSPNKQQMALTKARAYPTIAELAQPMLRLAGSRVNPKTNGPHRASGLPGTGIYSITLKKIDGGAETTVTMPPQARVSHVKFSPDGSQLAFLQTKDDRDRAVDRRRRDRRREGGRHRRGSHQRHGRRSLRLAARQRHDGVRAGAGGPRPGAGRAGRAGRADRPRELRQGGAGADLRGSPEDRARRCAVRLLLHEPAGGDQHRRPARRRRSASRRSSTTSRRRPTASTCSSAKIKKPFSHTVPMNGFAQDVEIWTRAGELAKKIADLPSREGTTLTGVEPDRAATSWRADQPATILWVEALDGGDLKNKVPFRDKVVALAAPFTGAADRGGEDRMAIRRHQLHRHRHRAAERERSRHAPDAHAG